VPGCQPWPGRLSPEKAKSCALARSAGPVSFLDEDGPVRGSEREPLNIAAADSDGPAEENVAGDPESKLLAARLPLSTSSMVIRPSEKPTLRLKGSRY
jgi:hypothetical protein